MVSPELLRRYPFFSVFDDRELNEVAMAARELNVDAGTIIFDADQPATELFLLLEGGIELAIVAADRHGQGVRQLHPAGDVNIGDIAGISALIAPCIYTASGRATEPSRLIAIDAALLRGLCADDVRLDAALMHAVSQEAMRRLHDARVQLMAARN